MTSTATSTSFGLGVGAALGAPLIMTMGFILWDKHWEGSAFALNLFKCNLASIGFLILSISTRDDGFSGGAFPADVFTVRSVGFLMLSSTIGIVVGDWTWLEGLRLLGARKVIVVDTCKPFLAAFLGWLFLGEELHPAAFGGIVLTAGGVLLVSWENTDSGAEKTKVENDVVARTEEEPTETMSQYVGNNIDNENNVLDAQQDSDVVSTTSKTVHKRILQHADQGLNAKEVNVIDRQPSRSVGDARKGFVYSVLNVVLDTFGSLLTKEYGVGMTTWEINLIRFGFAGIVMLMISASFYTRDLLLLLSLSTRTGEPSGPNVNNNSDDDENHDDNDLDIDHAHQIVVNGKDTNEIRVPWYGLPIQSSANVMTKRSWLQVIGGVVLVTFATPALSNYALFRIALGLALTLGSVGPLYALPLSWWLQSDRPTLRAVFGACLAVAGVVVLSLFGAP